ncbi:response regulator [Fonticella tunisiensis]|uniref:Stage 0 sporulation protein A homolog n=1 Tax=Fonticella tunisiensis TaxID=1096341 RepID=A0A4R7KWB2_9CLOT|nr:response regulator [Fonticella tunisiensis]TDT63270.1 two-component system response regulator YesN [Fonticella tunisiensis]
MYKLILVDDEEEVRRGILEKIEWERIGYEVIGEAGNGIDALEIAEKTIPDVVITDIKMPFMDGITLCEKLKERFPTTKIIILTGFDEFEYAQRAIKLNVVEYVLKPISSRELIDILEKVKAALDNEIVQRKDIEALREHYKKSLPLLREKFLGSLIDSRMNRDEILEKSRTYGIDIDGKTFAVSVISVGRGSEGFEENIDFSEADNNELIRVAALNISEEIIKKHGSGTAFLYRDYIVIIFTFENDNSDALVNWIFTVLEEIRQNIEKYYGAAVTIGVGSLCSSITEIPYSYKGAVAALDYRMILNSSIIYVDDVEPKCTSSVVFDELKERSLISCIKVGTDEEIVKTIDRLFEEIIDRKASFKDYQIYLLEMLTTILKVARDLNADMDRIFGTNYNLFVELYKFRSLKEVKDWIRNICIRIRSYISRDRQDTCKLIVKRAREYVEQHYGESDITIDKVCKYLHISPTYFSTLFKKETKLTFVNYLTQVRMEAAKELLRTTDLKSFEIARKVGYSEPNYFSYSFKKNFNMSPSQYRKAFK